MLAERQRQVTTVLAVSNLSVLYGGRPVIHDLTFSLESGVVVLAGPNGAGKTTILRVLATLLPFEGAVVLDGCDLSTASGRRRARSRLGFLPQEAAFPDDFTVAEAITYAAWLQRVPARARRAAVDAALATVDLAGRAATPLKELSTGLRRRAFLAQAIVHQPPVLLLDEPTAGVDTEHRAGFRRMVRSLAEDRLVVLSTHLTEEIEFLADRILVLGGGRIRFDGTPVELEAMAGAGRSDERRVEGALRALTDLPEAVD
ncbi:MAG: ATP-binding cassette domain-containing protein [Acidimicrobiia bacterium]